MKKHLLRGGPFGKRVAPRAPLLNLSLRAISSAFARLRRMKSLGDVGAGFKPAPTVYSVEYVVS